MDNNALATKPVGGLVLKFAIPSVISMVVGSLYNIVDQIFIGQGVGMLGNAATNIAFPISIIALAIALMLGVGGASRYNLDAGAGNPEKAVRAAGTSLFLLSVSGLALSAAVLIFIDPCLQLFGVTPDTYQYAFDYMQITAYGLPPLILTIGGTHLIRADRSPGYSMACNLTGTVINTILDPLFIFGFGWGIKGGAWATVIGQIVSGCMVALYFVKMRKMKLTLRHLLPGFERVKTICMLGIGSFANQISIAPIQILLNNVLKTYGALSVYGPDIPLACAGVISKVNFLFLSVVIGISQGCQPIWGYNYGAGNYARVKKTLKISASAVLVLGAVFMLAFQFFPRQIVMAFGTGSEEYYIFAERYFRIFMMMTLVNGLQPLAAGFITSIGKGVLGLFMSLTRQVLFLLPLLLIFPSIFGIDGILYTAPIADFAAVTAAVALLLWQCRALTRKAGELVRS